MTASTPVQYSLYLLIMTNLSQQLAAQSRKTDNPPTKLLRFDKAAGRYTPAKRGEKFVKGPIPLWWISQANSLSGKAGAVGLALWFLRGVQRTDCVKLTAEVRSIAGCKRQAVYHALEALEGAGLVVVHSKPGAYPTVEIRNDQEHAQRSEDSPAQNVRHWPLD